jgi:hypothetical protein
MRWCDRVNRCLPNADRSSNPEPMRSPIFLSYAKPWSGAQDRFVDRVSSYLRQRGFEPRTLGVTDYDMDAPLRAIRRLMLESNGLVTIAFRRILITEGTATLRDSAGKLQDKPLADCWLTTPWTHIEAAMAYQVGLPILILREQGVLADGLLEHGIAGLYMPEIEVEGDLDAYFVSPEWMQPIGQWEGRVRTVIERKGDPPELF